VSALRKRLSHANSRWVDELWRADVSVFNSIDTPQPGSMRRGIDTVHQASTAPVPFMALVPKMKKADADEFLPRVVLQ
jgi:hypothetical protein